MADVDELYSLKISYFLGDFEGAIAEARSLRIKSETVKLEREVFVHRAYIGLGNYDDVIDGISDTAPVALQAVKLLASYLRGAAGSRNVTLLALEDWLSDSAAAGNPTLALMAATIYLHEGNYAAALRAVSVNPTMEHMALSVQVYLRMDRPDLAEKALAVLVAADDESALTQLSTALVYLALGGDKYKEASLVYKDLLDRHRASLVALNGLATAYIAMKRLDDAERLLQEALAKAPADPDTLINLIALTEAQGRPGEAAAKYLPALREAAPGHVYLKQLDIVHGTFDRVATAFAV